MAATAGAASVFYRFPFLSFPVSRLWREIIFTRTGSGQGKSLQENQKTLAA
jgi:hypothetical protein